MVVSRPAPVADCPLCVARCLLSVMMPTSSNEATPAVAHPSTPHTGQHASSSGATVPLRPVQVEQVLLADSLLRTRVVSCNLAG